MTTEKETRMELAEFLLARVAEDEAVARAATAGPWRWDEPSKESWPQSDESLASWAGGEWEPVLTGWGYDASGINAEPEDRAHIARWDPTRILAECDAKRRVVELHAIAVTRETVNPLDGPAYEEAERTCAICGWVPDACDTVKALAAVYADHPDYDEAWRL